METTNYRTVEDYFNQNYSSNIETIYTDTYRNTQTTWFPGDTEDQFKKNYFKYKDDDSHPLFRDSVRFYKEFPFSYSVNKAAFRDTPLKSKPKEVDVFIGCSLTFGIGIPSEHLWTTKLTEYLDFPTINAGIPGSGIIAHYRVLVQLSQKFKIRNVYHYLSSKHARYDWYKENLSQPGNGKMVSLISDKPNLSISELENFFNDKNLSLVQHSFKYALLGFCKQNNINLYTVYCDLHSARAEKLLSSSSFKSEYKFDNSFNFLARDLLHLTLKQNHFVYLLFLRHLGVNFFEDTTFNAKLDEILTFKVD